MAFKELKVNEWMDEVDRGLDFRKEFGKEEHWHELEQIFYLNHPSQDHSAPNIITSQGDALLSMLSVPVPHVSLKARRAEFVDKVRTLEALDNDLINDLDIGEAYDEAVIHAFLWGKGILKLGYDSEWGYSTKFNVDEDLAVTLTQFDDKERLIEFGPAKPGFPWV